MTLFVTQQNRLPLTVFLAAVFHAVLLYNWHWSFVPPSPLKIPPPELKLNLQLSTTPTTESIATAILAKEAPTLKKRTVTSHSFLPQDASYLTRWKSYVENVGNAHYPKEALRNGLKGECRLLVAINKDGSLNSVEVLKSSGSQLLDAAALNTIHQAAPFEPLPIEISKDIDVLEIIRTWRYQG